MIRIIHISDFHLESEELPEEKKEILGALIHDLEKYITDKTVLFFTGDLVDKGGLNFKNKSNVYKKFEEFFINKILIKFPILKGKIFVVPGNHEVNRSKIDKITEKGLKSSLINQKELSDFIDENWENSNHLDRLSEYKDWERDFYQKYNNKKTTNFSNSFVVEFDSLKIGISCLNSSWLCKDDNDQGNLLLGKKQITNSLKEIENTDIKFALMHHPLEFYQEFDQKEIKLLFLKKFNALFTGHVHELSSTQLNDLTGNIFISISNSTIADNPKERANVNGYSVIDYYPNDKIIAHYRKYIEQHSVFVANTDIGTEDGKKDFLLLKETKLTQYNQNFHIVSSLESRMLDKLNDDIIVSNNYTNINCSINNLFVEPTITNNPEKTTKKEETVEYTIDSILNDNINNYLIFGLKESGKTILLDKFFIDCLSNFNKYSKIPVLLKFNQLEKDFYKLFREFLGISSQDIKEYLQNNKIVLFIDDMNFYSKSSKKIENLGDFLKSNKNIQLVVTSTLVLENVIPENYFNFSSYFNFNIGFIQQFNSKQIKQLVSKWYIGKNIDLKENMQKLIKSFVDFGLPRNPLSVTLFLWVFEKQEKKPINNSVLVELFIENLLEKTKIENIYSETFDFKNKQRLLSFISKFMHDKGDVNDSYSIDYIELLTFVKVYIKKRASIKPQKVLDDFIIRSILSVDDENLVRFKSAVFFHYFLALHFDYNTDFKEEVLQEDNFLNYFEEISYYSGLKRDDEELLKFTQEQLLKIYGGINENIKDNPEKVDKVLEPNNKKGIISFKLNEDSVTEKLSENQLDEIYDDTLERIPIKKEIKSKREKKEIINNIDKVLKLSSIVLKNSEDIDDFDLKKMAYSNVLLSSISFLMIYRDSLIMHFKTFKKTPENFPKNIDFNLFVKFLPFIFQVMLFDWLGSQKMRPVILEKIKKDKQTVNISELEKFISVFLYSDIRGSNYPKIIKEFLRETKHKYLKDISFLKILSYFQLRKNDAELDKEWLNLLAKIKTDLGQLPKKNKGSFIKNIENKKDK